MKNIFYTIAGTIFFILGFFFVYNSTFADFTVYSYTLSNNTPHDGYINCSNTLCANVTNGEAFYNLIPINIPTEINEMVYFDLYDSEMVLIAENWNSWPVTSITNNEPDPIIGCMDETANNYDPTATEDEDPTLCTYDPIPEPEPLEIGELTEYIVVLSFIIGIFASSAYVTSKLIKKII